MSDGLKYTLIIGGAAAAAYLIWKNNQTTAGSLSTPGASTSATAPGAPTSPTPGAVVGAVTVGASGTSSTSKPSGPSISGAAGVVGKVLAAPVVVPTLLAVKTGEAIGSGVVSVGKSIGHALTSIF